MTDEIFKPIIGYENEYMVSNLGTVKSKSRNGTQNASDWKILSKSKDKYGYEKIKLSKDNEAKYFSIHRLVAQAFIETPELQVNHKNGIKHDNRVENLEWVTCSENVKHTFDVLNRKNHFLGKKHSEESIAKIREARKGQTASGCNHSFIEINDIKYRGIRPACRELNICRSTLVNALKNNTKEIKSNGIVYKIKLFN